MYFVFSRQYLQHVWSMSNFRPLEGENEHFVDEETEKNFRLRGTPIPGDSIQGNTVLAH